MRIKILLIAIATCYIIVLISVQRSFANSHLPPHNFLTVNAQTYYVIDETKQAILPTATLAPTPQPTKALSTDAKNASDKKGDNNSAPKNTGGGGGSGIEGEIIQLINQRRGQDGLLALSYNAALTQAARRQSRDNSSRGSVGECSHTGSDGSDFVRRSSEAGYNAFGETVGCGHSSAQSIVDAWWNSPPHKAILTNASIKVIGVGWAQDKHSAQTALVGF